MKSRRILIDHGSGGLATKELIAELFQPLFSNPALDRMEDSALLEPQNGKIAFTTDSYVVDPLFFPGGDIGTLAIHGTINDLAMQGANPAALSLGLILEEGLQMDDLQKIASSLEKASKQAGVPIVAADTKVVPQGKADKIFINTSGIGFVEDGVELGSHLAVHGDAVIVSGTLGDHGIAIMGTRAGLGLDTTIMSDTAPLHKLVHILLGKFGNAIRCFRDPTRGGLATVLSEIAVASRVEIQIDEASIPIKPQVYSICELLGLDPLYLANEGKLIAIVKGSAAEEIVLTMRREELGENASIIGRVHRTETARKGRVVLLTKIGGKRLLEPLSGEPLPRIC